MNRCVAAFVLIAVTWAGLGLPAPADAPVASPEGYTLSATAGPPPLTTRDCRTDPACVAAPAPAASTAASALATTADDQPALAAAIAVAAGRAVPAVVDATGAVVTPAQPGTVLLARGTYRLGRPLLLPPNVNLRGAGITATTLLLAPGSWRNFGYSFLIRPDRNDTADNVVPGNANLVSDLTVNGSCKVGAGEPDPTLRPALACDLGAGDTYGGGVKAGNHWTVRQVRFTNLNYFKLWVVNVVGVAVVDNRFDGWGGAGSGDEDNIGGGGKARDLLIQDNQWDETIRGNGIDLVNAERVTIRRNTVRATPFYLDYRSVGDYGSVILEGVTGSTIEDNAFYGAHLAVQSNSRYQHTGTNLNVTNPRGLRITGNRFVGSFWAGITVNYDDYAPAGGHQRRPGGANLISGNTIVRPAQSGILIFGRSNADKDAADTVSGNTILDPGHSGSASYAGFDTTGIGLGIGAGDTISGNHVRTAGSAPAGSGVQLGQRGAATSVTGTVLTGNTTGG